MEDFKQDNVSCKVVLTKQDRLGIVEDMYNYATGPESLWVAGSCSNCYSQNDPTGLKANHTKNFEELWDKTVLCFRQFINLQLNDNSGGPFFTLLKEQTANGNLCSNCSIVYNQMRSYFWDHVVPTSHSNTIGGVCYDIRDRVSFQQTIIWNMLFKTIYFSVQCNGYNLERELWLWAQTWRITSVARNHSEHFTMHHLDLHLWTFHNPQTVPIHQTKHCRGSTRHLRRGNYW